MRGHKCLFVDPFERVCRLRFQPCPNLRATPGRLFAEIVVLLFLMAEKPSQVTCAECQRLLKDYADASLKRVRAHGNVKLANLRSDSETMEVLAEALATATEHLEEVKERLQEHDASRHAFQNPTHQTS